jgi:hypothetical protein
LNRDDHLLEDLRIAKNMQKTNNAAEAETAAVIPESQVQSTRDNPNQRPLT